MNSRSSLRRVGALLLGTVLASCGGEPPPEMNVTALEVAAPRPEIYADFELTADLSALSDNQREMVKVLVDASQIMDDLAAGLWR